MSIKKADLAIGIYLLAAVIFMIIPIPSVMLDALLAINIAVALTILLNALFSAEALNMSTFPTVLLFSTIFRISLNVSSTRLILTTGDPGEVVKTFGSFVGGGDLIVGIIVFLILLIVQFMVINKGSERVAEVTARFTLDAMPGKQMAIDADLGSGAIDEKEAIAKRQKIQDESAFFGAMDGATKYVKGDAMAGLVITFINLIGGLCMGMLRESLELSEALDKYCILTIGDGLVSQVPSLMISLSTGVLVTKVSKEADIGDILVKQLFSLPKVMYFTGGVLILLGVFTPLPFFIFCMYGIVFFIAGSKISKTVGIESIEEEMQPEEAEAEEMRKPENVNSLLQIEQIELDIGYGMIPLVDVNQGGDLLDRVVLIRRQIALDMGCVVPFIRVRDNIQLNPNEYVIKIKNVVVSQGEILFDHYMAIDSGYLEEEITGIPTVEPAYNLPAIWITESQREKAESVGYTVVDPSSVIATHLTEVIKSHIDELLTRQDVTNLINNIKDANETLISELVPKLLGVGEIQKVLQNLLREGISIRDLVTIFETLADYAPMERDTVKLTEYVRQNLKRVISRKFFNSGEATSVVTLDPRVEQDIRESLRPSEGGAILVLDPEKEKSIVNSIKEEVGKLEDMGKDPIIVTSPMVRTYFKMMTSDYFKDLIVLSYGEIDSDVEFQSVGMVTA